MDTDYLGCGMKFPIQINPASGRVETSSGNLSVKESIFIILSTNHTERLTRPTFGANLDQYAFLDVSYATLSMMVRTLTETILSQEPRVSDLEIIPEPDLNNGRLILNVNYSVSGNYEKESLVYPFYLNIQEKQEEEEPEIFSQLEE